MDQKPEWLKRISTRPSVHQLCSGVFLQEPLMFSDAVIAPLSPLGMHVQATWTATYAKEVLGAAIDQQAFDRLLGTGADSNRCIVVALLGLEGDSPERIQAAGFPKLQRYRAAMSWMTGNEVVPYGLVTAMPDHVYFQLLPIPENKRHWLGLPDNAGMVSKLEMMLALAETNEHFAFALSLLHDANTEANTEFKIARLFSCLESLAYKIKSKDRPSRKAISFMKGRREGSKMSLTAGGDTVRFDELEMARLIRDKLFHGAPIEPKDYPGVPLKAFEYLKLYPQQIISALKSACEVEISAWTHDQSIARTIAEGNASALPVGHPALTAGPDDVHENASINS